MKLKIYRLSTCVDTLCTLVGLGDSITGVHCTFSVQGFYITKHVVAQVTGISISAVHCMLAAHVSLKGISNTKHVATLAHAYSCEACCQCVLSLSAF